MKRGMICRGCRGTGNGRDLVARGCTRCAGGGYELETPWDVAQTARDVGQGVLCVTTAGHGGYYVPDELLSRIPEACQLWAAKWSGSRNWYEEDCCWAAVAVAFPELFPDHPSDCLELARKLVMNYCPSVEVTHA